ncbi:CADD family putative folate metabolism protein [Patescibacteria group bacterium]|nr:CADD family putative folate metabolism protein [Patescibacteria group bacterium]
MHSPFITHLKNRIAEKRLLSHPFYQHWNAGTLPKDVLVKYAEQYYHLEKNFPRFLAAMRVDADIISGPTITANLYDEERDTTHRELWLRFGEGVGAVRTDIENSTPLPETATAVKTFESLSRESMDAGVSALAAYESQIPEVAVSKLDGLKKHYGIEDTRTTEFFSLHGKVDVAHSDAWWDIIDRRVAEDPTLKEKIEDAVVLGRDALWSFLDGVCRAYFPQAFQGMTYAPARA